MVQVDGQAEIQLVCTNTAQWNIGLDAGTFPGATVTTRAMTGPTGFHINYELFSDPARTTNWGDTVGTDTVSGTGNGGVEVLNAPYGRIPASQAPGYRRLCRYHYRNGHLLIGPESGAEPTTRQE